MNIFQNQNNKLNIINTPHQAINKTDCQQLHINADVMLIKLNKSDTYYLLLMCGMVCYTICENT